MSRCRLLTALALSSTCLLCLSLSSFAQQADPPKPEKLVSSPICDAERALALVSDQLDELKAVTPKWRRADLYCDAARLLWKQRQAKAREVFQAAFELAKESVATQEGPALIVPGEARIVTRGDLRLEVIRAIAKLDMRWAQQLTDELLAEEKARTEKLAAKERGTDLYDQLPYQAEQLLVVDQAAALNVARQSLARPNGLALGRFLVALAKQDRAAADAFFLEALGALAVRSINETLALSCYPFATLRPLGAGWRSGGVTGAPDLQPNSVLQARYLETLFQLAAALAAQPLVTTAPQDGAYQLSPAARLLTGLNDLEPLVAARFEPLYGRFLEAKRELASVVTTDYLKTVQAISDSKREEAQGNAFERNLNAAEREKDPARKDRQYYNAIQAGINTEPPEQLESLLLKISDANLRSQLGDWLYYNLAQRALKAGQIDEATKFAEHVSPLDLRACLSFTIADTALAKLNDRPGALSILETAWRLADRAELTNEKAKALLGVSQLYLRIDRGQALTALRAAVKAINQLQEPDVSSGGFVRMIKGPGFTQFNAYTVPEMTLSKGFQELGKFDFETALSVAHELDDKVLRAGAVLALSSFCLENAAGPTPNAKPSATKPEGKRAGARD